jgi:hypothetical protein
MCGRTKRDYELDYPTPLPYERSLYNMGFDPRGTGERYYKNLDVEGLAAEFCKFEDLYDSNYQAYHWLWHTGYGEMLFRMLMDAIKKEGFEHTVGYSLNSAANNAIKHVRVMQKMHE